MTNKSAPIRAAKRRVLGILLGMTLLFTAAPAVANDYDSNRSAHPLRIIAYVLHPVGLIVDTLIFRPAHWLVQWDFTAALFGHEEDE